MSRSAEMLGLVLLLAAFGVFWFVVGFMLGWALM
jgi:hypothetical protein